MRVALDATPLTLSSGGIARYVRELSRALVTEFPQDQYVLVSDQPFQAPAGVSHSAPPVGWLLRRWWSFGLQQQMSRLGAEVFHGTHFTVPWHPLRPSVATFHDLSPWMDPAWHNHADFVRRRAPYLASLGIATRIITPSEVIRRAVIDRFRLHPDRVRAIPHAAAAHFRPSPGPPRSKPYFVCVSALEPRKNLGMLVAAWREVYRRTGVELLLVGLPRKGFAAPPPEPGLHLVGEVAEEELPGLYSGCVACLYPSLYEGFGLPVLEAMQCGALVIASRDPAVLEVASDAALSVDAADVRGWVAAMDAAAGSADSLSAIRDRAPERARRFSWAQTARLTREVYLDALNAFPG